MSQATDVWPFVEFAASIVGGLLLLLIALVGFLWRSLNAKVGELAREQVAQLRDVVELRTAFRFYLDRTGIDSAKILAGSANPTPLWAQVLLDKYTDNRLTDPTEKEQLREWLVATMNDKAVAKGERSIALQLLAAMDTLERHALQAQKAPDA